MVTYRGGPVPDPLPSDFDSSDLEFTPPPAKPAKPLSKGLQKWIQYCKDNAEELHESSQRTIDRLDEEMRARNASEDSQPRESEGSKNTTNTSHATPTTPTMSAGKISLSLGASKKAAPTNGVKRPHAALRDHDEDGQNESRAQTVTHFDREAGGAVDEKKTVQEQGPLIIAPQKNRDWKEAGSKNKRARYAQVADAERAVSKVDVEMEVENKKPSFGLIVSKRKEEVDVEEQAESSEDANRNMQNDTPDAPQQPRTADEEAMDALLGNKKQSTLVLPAMNEDQAFDRDYKTAPDMSTLADYDRVPVEEFGAAMLRGMGWKDGEGIGAERGKKAGKTSVPKRRPALLGIGAKEEAAVAEEMGAWGKAARQGKGGEVKIYNPVLLRDKRTGEMFTEKEAEERKAKDERERYEMEFEEAEKKNKDKEKGSERNGDRKSSRRETSSERRDRKERDRRKYDDSDDEYYRRKKEKERRRRDERDGIENDRDRERWRKHNGDRERRQESSRERHRDRYGERRR
ncbi:DNA primase large subunit Spp2 [Extremus antarcticus]|uniref:Pre-mRNA-splicing factor n=1 Tax=Extremus antarcticus TaxID=702011 RepID=A0AAJ0DMK4_9PEZI|nr:DNA primase large subunit Spp2 [Extremus antarcticus]